MAVPASERNIARGEFVNAVVKVETRTAMIVRKFPKRWEHDLTAHLIGASRRMTEAAAKANAIYPDMSREYEDKLSLLNEAYGLLVYIDMTVDAIYRSDPYKEIKRKDKNGQEVVVKKYFMNEKSVNLLAGEIEQAENLIGGLRKSLKAQMKKLGIQ